MPHALLDNLIAAKDSSSADIALAISAEFDKTYQQKYDGLETSWLGDIMLLGNPSQRRTETFGMLESMPVPELWHRGDPIPTEGTGSKRFSVTNYTYAKRIKWHREDREDTLIGDVLPRFRSLADRMALVASKAAIEIITASASLLPAIPNAPDGVALFNATDGDSLDRFGRSGGNILSITGVTAATLRTDFYEASEAFGNFQDTKGEPYFEPGVGEEVYTVLASLANMAAFNEAFRLDLMHSVVSTTGAAIGNTVLASGAKLQIQFTSRLSGNTWYLFRGDAPVKPLFELVRRPVQEESALADGNNSDEVRNTGYEYIQYSKRCGFGVNVPFGAIKIA